MKINGTSNNSFQNKVLIDTFIEQISALQTDVGNLQIADDNLSQALATKANTADINTAVNTGTLGAQTGNIKTLNVQGTGSSATIENATIGTASIGTETVTDSTITTLHVTDEHAGTVRTGTLTVENDATISGDVSVQDVSAKDITSASVNTLNITAAEADLNKIEARNAEITGKLEVHDLEVSGNFTGVSNIETESVNTEDITADTAEIETLDVENIRSWVTQVMNQERVLTPSPALDNNDRYTIELPSFDGVYLLSWEDADVVWSATVIGNGKTYGISWGSRTDQNYITDLFQYNGKLYIRVNSNGKLKYAYSTTKELPNPVIYFNMNGWTPDKSLEELCDENAHLINAYPSGMSWFGPVFIPRLQNTDKDAGTLNFKGSCTFAELPTLADSNPGDVWNITNEAYTDDRFVEGSGKPINAGDDIVAVKVSEEETPDEPMPYAEEQFGPDSYIDKLYPSLTADGKMLVEENDTLYRGLLNSWVDLDINVDSRTGSLVVTHTGKIVIIKSDSTLVYSDDNGATWNSFTDPLFSSGGPSWLAEIDNRLWIVWKTANSNYLYYSDNDGNTWSSVSYDFPGTYNDLSFIKLDNELFGSVTSSNFRSLFVKSTDGGLTWEPTISVPEYDLSSLSYIDGYIFANGADYREDADYGPDDTSLGIFRSNDYGATWTRIYPIHDQAYLRVIDNVIYVVDTDQGEILASYDKGDTFETFVELSGCIDICKFGDYFYITTYSDGLYYYSKAMSLSIKWDKFSAGVNYDNFVARNITATHALKSEGTLSVDGNSTLHNINQTGNTTQTGNYTATGNLNRTGNETIIGTVVIGDLD